MSSKNPLPFSNQFERGHSFNWAGRWEEGKYYFNDEYVTDFSIYENALIACRKNHMSSLENRPTLIYNGASIIGIDSIYWEFIVDLSTTLYLPTYDPNTGEFVWEKSSIKSSPETISEHIDFSPLIRNKIKVNEHIYLTQEEYDELVNSEQISEDVLYLIYEDDDSIE